MIAPVEASLDVSAVPVKPAGAGRYTLELAHALASRDDVELTLLCRGGDSGRWEALAPSARVMAVSPRRAALRLGWEQVSLARLLPRLGVAVHHAPHYTMPEATRLPRVVTVHDLTFFDHPEWHQRAKVPFFRRAIRVAARRAEAVICVSQATADRLAEICPPRSPVRVIPHGVDLERFAPSGPDDASVLTSLGVRRPYVAFVGTLEPRKDVPTLVRAFDRIAGDHPDLTLVLAGFRGWGAKAVDEAVAETAHQSRIKSLGYLAQDHVPVLLRQASAVAYPSLAEGFGLPILEALACGAPLVTTTGSATEEVASGAALLVEPSDSDALAGALDMLVRGDAGLPARRKRGLDVAARHTWEGSAASHVEAYRSVVARS